MSNDLTLFSSPELKDTVQDMRVMFKGVNNLMGSKMTTSSTQMYQIFSILKKRNLFFIDSLTTSESLCKPSARLLQLPFAQRDVFIDHIQEPDFIRKQINLLIRIADKHGEAIGNSISVRHPVLLCYSASAEPLPSEAPSPDTPL